MINLLKQHGGVPFPGKRKRELRNLCSLPLGCHRPEKETKQNGNTLRVAIRIGSQHGPVIAHQVQQPIPTATLNGYQVPIFAGFAFASVAQSLIQTTPVAGMPLHLANIAPGVLAGDLLKTPRASQICAVFA
ncbi:MAG: hypothetical protein KatS3mg110_4278 [Pirellulaceae bacterium]|nr:MAG: hypothetical protein KatS3mg110_4278 [Pirellulaceae bacterium]